MPALVPFTRTATLAVAGPSLVLSGIPQTAQHLAFIVRARSDNLTSSVFLGLRLNADAGPNTYDGNTMRFVSAAAAGLQDDGIDLEQVGLQDLVPSDTAAGIWGYTVGWIPRYSVAEPHAVIGQGFSRPDDVATSDANFGTYGVGAQHVPAVLAAVSSLEVIAESGNLAVGSQITVIGFLEQGDATVYQRSAQVGTVLDFAGAAFKDVTLTPGANTFTSTNPRLGRTLTLRCSGGDGTTTIALPAGTEKLSDSYVPGAPAWIAIQCVDEGTPGFVANIRDVL